MHPVSPAPLPKLTLALLARPGGEVTARHSPPLPSSPWLVRLLQALGASSQPSFGELRRGFNSSLNTEPLESILRPKDTPFDFLPHLHLRSQSTQLWELTLSVLSPPQGSWGRGGRYRTDWHSAEEKAKTKPRAMRTQLRTWGLRTESRPPPPNSEHMFPMSFCQGARLCEPSRHHLPRQTPPGPSTPILRHTMAEPSSQCFST